MVQQTLIYEKIESWDDDDDNDDDDDGFSVPSFVWTWCRTIGEVEELYQEMNKRKRKQFFK